MNQTRSKTAKRIVRHRRVRAKILGTAERPRISVFRSNKHVFVQFIDDAKKKTILSSKEVSDKKAKGSKTEQAQKMGELLGKKAKEVGIKEAVFDRGGFRYHGRVKALADGLRAGGVKI